MNRRQLMLSLSALTTFSVSSSVLGSLSAAAQTAGALLPVAFKVTGAKYLKGQPHIAVGSYPLTFILGARAKATTGSFALGGVDLSVYLDGPTETNMRGLADEALNDLLARFKTAGFATVAPTDVLANAEIARIKRASGNVAEEKGILDSRATKSWVSYSATEAPLFEGQGKMPAGEFLLLGKFGKAGKALAASIIQPRLFIDFTNLNASKQRVVTSGTARAGGELEFSIDPLSITHVITPDSKGLGLFARLDPKGQVLSDRPVKGELIKNAAKPAVNVASIFGKASIHALRVDVEDWKTHVRAAFGGYNQALVDEFVKARA